MADTNLFTEALGHLAYYFTIMQPMLPMAVHLILSALFPIFTGAHSSLSRPSSAAKPAKKKKHESQDSENEDEDEEPLSQKMEGLSPSDAIIFPLLAGCTLTGLYLLIKYMGADMLNKVLNWYFSTMAIFSIAKLVNDGLSVLGSFVYPDYYAANGMLWRVDQRRRRASTITSLSGNEVPRRETTSPLPWWFGRIALPQVVEKLIWSDRGLASQKFLVKGHVRGVTSLKIRVTFRSILSTVIGLLVVLYANLVSTPWYLTNLQGFAFSYTALQLMSPTTFATGSMILVALFFYDIYFVFYTPMMVTVAGQLDVPIKLLFPRPSAPEDTKRNLAMLGLGDVVLPGIMIGLALRFDLFIHYVRKQSSLTKSTVEKGGGTDESSKQPYESVTGRWGDRFWTGRWHRGHSQAGLATQRRTAEKPTNVGSRESANITSKLLPTFPKPYFYASIVGYVFGMSVTLFIMQVFKHAQPALLYLVPGVLGSIWLTGLIRGEIKELWSYTEAIDEEDDNERMIDDQEEKRNVAAKDAPTKDKEATKGWMEWLGQSFFSTQKSERNAARLEKHFSRSVNNDEDKDEESESKSDTPESKQRNSQKEKNRSPFSFSISRLHHPSTGTADSLVESTSKPGQQGEGSTTCSLVELSESEEGQDVVSVSSSDVNMSSEKPTVNWRRPSARDDERAGKRVRTS